MFHDLDSPVRLYVEDHHMLRQASILKIQPLGLITDLISDDVGLIDPEGFTSDNDLGVAVDVFG